MFKNKKQGLIVIHDDNLFFISYDHHKKQQILDTFSISSFLDTDTVIEISEIKFQDYDFPLLVVPDFWLGSRTYDFQSTDKSAIESFISRKLKVEFPQNQGVQNLFSYDVARKTKGSQEIVSLFMQEPKAGELLERLAVHRFRPVRIASPGLIWNARLKRSVGSFEKQNIGLLYLINRECFLLFFYKGNFLFSRTIPLPEVSGDDSSRADTLTYEINQSAYHLSQRTKAQLDRIFLVSRADDNTDRLREKIGRNITVLDEKTAGIRDARTLSEELGLAADFTPEELTSPDSVPGVSDRLLIKEIETNRIQITGIIIGLVLLVMLCAELSFLINVSRRESSAIITGEEDPKAVIEHYNNTLDSLLADNEREKPLSVIGRLAASLPQNIVIESLEIEQEPSPSIYFRGQAAADDINDFSSTLRSLVENINTNLNISNQITIDNIEIEMTEKQPGTTRLIYHISFRLDLI
ncbi:MAG: hypothetical protein JW927_18960 [Deltaproteobacteria bacterium]|nr:hypothetical protein [Deltaproteobacteria bacterium]